MECNSVLKSRYVHLERNVIPTVNDRHVISFFVNFKTFSPLCLSLLLHTGVSSHLFSAIKLTKIKNRSRFTDSN